MPPPNMDNFADGFKRLFSINTGSPPPGTMYFIFLLIFIIIHIIDFFFLRFARSLYVPISISMVLYLFFGIFFYIIFKNDQNVTPQGIIFLLSYHFFVPLIMYYTLPRLSITYLGIAFPTAVVTFFIALFPAFPLYIVFFTENCPQKLRTITTWLLIIILIFSFFYAFQMMNQGAGFEIGGRTYTLYELSPVDFRESIIFAKDFAVRGILGMRDFGRSVWTGVTSEVERTMLIASGEYYDAEVDKSAAIENLGVRLDQVKATREKFTRDDPVSVYTVLRARTLDEPINITVGCVAQDNIEASNIFPRSNFRVEGWEEFDIDCYFERGRLSSTYNDIKITAEFNFKTMSYLKTYFIDGETRRAMRQSGIDPFRQYGIPIDQTQPRAFSSNSPVKVGMSIERDLPIGLEGDEQRFTLGITLDSIWFGEVKGINNIAIMLPRGLEIQKNDNNEPACNEYIFQESNCEEFFYNIDAAIECDDSAHNFYKLSPDQPLTGFKGFRTFRCPMVINKDNYQTILGESPFSTRYVRTTVSYTYEVSSGLTIGVEQGEAIYDTLKVKTCSEDAKTGLADAEILDQEAYINRYTPYQKFVEDAIRSRTLNSGQDELTAPEYEALIATILDSATGMGENLYDRETEIRYNIGRCRTTQTLPKDDISCVAEEVRIIFERQTSGTKEEKIKSTIREYFSGRMEGIDETFLTNAINRYKAWLRAICGVGSTDSGEGTDSNGVSSGTELIITLTKEQKDGFKINYGWTTNLESNCSIEIFNELQTYNRMSISKTDYLDQREFSHTTKDLRYQESYTAEISCKSGSIVKKQKTGRMQIN